MSHWDTVIHVHICLSRSTSVGYGSFISLGNVRMRGILGRWQLADVDMHMRSVSMLSMKRRNIFADCSFQRRVKAFKEAEKQKKEDIIEPS